MVRGQGGEDVEQGGSGAGLPLLSSNRRCKAPHCRNRGPRAIVLCVAAHAYVSKKNNPTWFSAWPCAQTCSSRILAVASGVHVSLSQTWSPARFSPALSSQHALPSSSVSSCLPQRGPAEGPWNRLAEWPFMRHTSWHQRRAFRCGFSSLHNSPRGDVWLAPLAKEGKGRLRWMTHAKSHSWSVAEWGLTGTVELLTATGCPLRIVWRKVTNDAGWWLHGGLSYHSFSGKESNPLRLTDTGNS